MLNLPDVDQEKFFLVGLVAGNRRDGLLVGQTTCDRKRAVDVFDW